MKGIPEGLPDLSSLFSKVSENPQAMAMLSSLLGGMGNPSNDKKEEEPLPKKEEESKETALLLPHISGKKGKNDEKRRLLLALKPFLSYERQQAIDTLLLILEASSLFSLGKEPPCT